MALTAILRQSAPAWPSPQGCLARQPLDAMQTDIEPFCQHIMPDPTRTVGAVASSKA